MTGDDLTPEAPLSADGWDSIIDPELSATLSAFHQPGTMPEFATQASTLQAMAAVMTDQSHISAVTRTRGQTMINKLKTKAALVAVASAVVFGGAAAAATGGVPFVNEPNSDPTTVNSAVDSETTSTSTDSTGTTVGSVPESSTSMPEESTTVPESTSTTACTARNHGEHVSDVARDRSSENHGKSVRDAAHDDCGKGGRDDDSGHDDVDDDEASDHSGDHGSDDHGNSGDHGSDDHDNSGDDNHGRETSNTRPDASGPGNDDSRGNDGSRGNDDSRGNGHGSDD